jgi:hypothetical protein
VSGPTGTDQARAPRGHYPKDPGRSDGALARQHRRVALSTLCTLYTPVHTLHTCAHFTSLVHNFRGLVHITWGGSRQMLMSDISRNQQRKLQWPVILFFGGTLCVLEGRAQHFTRTLDGKVQVQCAQSVHQKYFVHTLCIINHE